MKHGKPIEENDLHAYVDGQLDSARRAEVEKYLEVNQEEAERLHVFERQNAMLENLFGPVLNEAVPERLPQVMKPGRHAVLWRYTAMAASLVCATLLGWFLRGEQVQEIHAPSLAREAAVAYAVYSPEILHPVEVGAAQEDHLVRWLSKRLGQSLKVPNLSSLGYELVGGRLLPGSKKPAAQFMYQNARGQRLTLYLSTEVTDSRETAFRYARQGKVGVFYWVDGPLGYALSGDTSREQLLNVAEAVYRDLNR